MAKTVMQAFIESVRTQHETIKDSLFDWDNGQAFAYQVILNDAEEMIKQERDQIEEAFKMGRLPLLFGNKLTASNYYEQTFVDNSQQKG